MRACDSSGERAQSRRKPFSLMGRIMHHVPGFGLSEILVQNAHTTILRGSRGDTPVLIRVPSSDSPTAADLARLRYDYSIASELNLRGVLKACDLEERDGTL